MHFHESAIFQNFSVCYHGNGCNFFTKFIIKVDASLLEYNVFIKIPDYAWPKYFGGYRELLLSVLILNLMTFCRYMSKTD